MPQGWPANVANAAAALVGTGARPPIALLVVPDGWGRTQTLDAAVALFEERGVHTDARPRPPRRTDATEAITAALGDGGVLVVDDAHWLDESSTQLLATIVDDAAADRGDRRDRRAPAARRHR